MEKPIFFTFRENEVPLSKLPPVKLAVVCDGLQKTEFLSKKIKPGILPVFFSGVQEIPPDTDILFDLLFEPTPERIRLLKQFLPRPVIVNAVNDTLTGLQQPFIRINAWPGFLARVVSEIAVSPEQSHLPPAFFESIGWQVIMVPDLPGMVSARITSMMINEAYFTLQEKISTENEIDIAMKTGTNYPFGPFEWSRKIGLKKIHALLMTLREADPLYEISPLLAEAALHHDIKKN